MMRTFRYPLHPTMAQAAVLEMWRIACQQLYNAALQERRDAWKRAGISITRIDQQKSLTIIRKDDLEWRAVPAVVTRSALRRIELAFQSFFRRVKAGEQPGYPRFRSRDRYDSFGLDHRPVRVKDGRVFVPKLGMVRLNLYRPLKGTVKAVTIKREAGKWFVCFACDLGEAPAKVAVKSAVGIDLGLTNFAVLSNGEAVDNPRHGRDAARALSKAQRRLSRAKRGSGRRKRAKAVVVHAYGRVRAKRLDHARKLACDLFARFDLIAHEDLQITRMVHGNLAKSIHDAAWGQFIEVLTCKAESAGKWCVPVDPRGTTQRCSGCGEAVPKALSERVHRCGICGLVLGRDHNAALNVLALVAVPGASGELRLVDGGSVI